MMGSRVASCVFFLHLVMVAQASGTTIREQLEKLTDRYQKSENDHVDNASEESAIIRMVTDAQENSMADQNQGIPSNKQEKEAEHEAHSSSHMNHMNPALMVFFTVDDLKLGKKLPIYFPKRDPSTSPPLLPKETADPIPFSLKQLPYILSLFSFSTGSPPAKAVEETLQQCEMKPIKGETKFCATSLESMVAFVSTAFGVESRFEFLATAHLTKSNVHFQNYTFLRTPEEIPAPKLVACHTMPYAYAVYYCHYQEGENRVLKIALEGENGDRVDAVAICHMDTSQWGRSHPSFQVLRIEPGTIPVCHFFPADDFVWIPQSA